MTGAHPLQYVCHEVHGEFSSALDEVAPLTATRIVAKVTDSKFKPLQKFSNRIPSPGTLDFRITRGDGRLVIRLAI